MPAEKVLSNLPEDLAGLESIDLSGLDQRISHCALTVLCDVENSLLGEQGAAKVFGPQKGATGPVIKKLETGLAKLRDVMFRQTGKDLAAIKHGGAAGGVAAGLQGFLNAKLVNGIDYFLDVTDFEDALQKANLVITGEGRMDEQTMRGKGPFGVALRARGKNVPVIGLAGRWRLRRMRHCDNILSSYWPSAIRPLNWIKPCRIQQRICGERQWNWVTGWR